MNVRPLLLPFVILISSFGLLHAAPPPELTVLSQQYEKTLAEKSTAPFDASLATLNTKFTAALDGAIATAQQAGRLDDILAIQDDKKRLAEKLPIPDDDDKTPDALKKLRTIYREQLKKLEDARTAAIATVLPAYTARLQELEVTLTKAGRFDEAKEVKDYRGSLNAGAAQVAPVPLLPSRSVTPAQATSKGGVIRGLGQFMFGNLPVDLTNAEGISDFVEVKVSHMGWVARRANGGVHFQIQSNGDKTRGIANLKKAVRVCATEGKPFYAIYEDGSVEMLGTPFDKTANPFPSATTNVADVDTASGLHLVLNREGECSFHGMRQQDMVTGLELKAPGVLPGVAAVSCSRYQAWFLMKDGSVKATSDFREKAPVWAKLPNDFKRGIRSLATGATTSRCTAITAAGKALDAQGAEINRKLKDLVEIRVGGDAAITKDAHGAWHILNPGDEEMGKLLTTTLAASSIIDIDLHNYDNSGDGKLVSRAVLWIEPVK